MKSVPRTSCFLNLQHIFLPTYNYIMLGYIANGKINGFEYTIILPLPIIILINKHDQPDITHKYLAVTSWESDIRW